MKNLGEFVYAILAGIFIALGGAVFLLTENKVVGAVLFSSGLFAVCTLKYNLFTGKVGYFFNNNPKTYIPFLFIVYTGNLVGTFLASSMLKATKHGPALIEKAALVSQGKIGDSMLSIFILAIFCNLFVVFSVDQYLNNPHELGKYLGIVYGVVVFILMGFEHCIANMFYFFMGNAWSTRAIQALLVATAGNALGGVIVPGFKIFKAKTEAE